MPQSDDPFAAFEREVADVPDAYNDLPGVPVDKDFVAHIEEVLQHFISHAAVHVYQAMEHGLDTVQYPAHNGATITVRATGLDVYVRYTVSPDAYDEFMQHLRDEHGL